MRIIQSVPSKKAEPIKQWLAKVGQERIQELADPSTALDRARDIWQKQGRSAKWIQQRMSGQETRNKLTDYWVDHGIKEKQEFAALTSIIHKEWTGLTVKEHKQLKNLKSQNLRDHMSEAELILPHWQNFPQDRLQRVKKQQAFLKTGNQQNAAET